MSRLQPHAKATLNPSQEAVWDQILGTRGDPQRLMNDDGSLIGPFNAMVASPDIGKRVAELGAAIRFSSTLPDRLLELAIVATGAHWKSNFEFWIHRGFAVTAGVTDAVLDALQSGQTPSFPQDDEAVVYTYVTELLSAGRVSDATWAATIEMLGEETTIDLTSTVGYYSLISLTLNAFEIPIPGDTPAIWP